MIYNKQYVNNLHHNQQFTCKQTIDQSELSDRARNCRRMEMVSIRQISCATLQKLGNLRSQTGNFVAQQSWAIKLLNFVACLTSALVLNSIK